MTTSLNVSNLRSALIGPIYLSVPAGTCATITGPSGSGKSLFLRMIADLDPNEGDVSLGDVSRSTMPAPHWRKRVVYIAAESGWWADDVISHYRRDQVEIATKVFEQFGLTAELLHGPVARLSTGERQRAALARGLLLSPSALLLDEPTSALDSASTAFVEEELRRRMSEGMSLVLVTHDDQQAMRLATNRFKMMSGHLETA